MTQLTLADRAPRAFTLQQILGFDALTCVAMGLLLLAAAAPLAGLLGLPQDLLFHAGAVLLPCAALMYAAARTLNRSLVWLVILGNVAWVVASVAVAFLVEPTSLGLVFIVAQAVVVDILAFLEWRKMGPAPR
jgi:hypothetical protein